MSTIKEYLEEIQGRPVAVIGMGVSNTPLIKMLLRAGAEVTVRDRVPRERAAEQVQELESLGARMILGEEYLQDLHEDVIFRTPGLSPNTPELVNAVQRGIELSSEMELFFQTCPSRLIGVTGSDGKTTTTTIIAEFLKEAGRNVYVGGNIGKPLLPDVADMVEEDFAVLELSSFQLMTMEQSPHIAVVTNLSPNHLDYHHTIEEYVRAKKNIFLHQGPEDRLILNYDNAPTRALAREAVCPVTFFSRQERLEEGVYLRDGAIWLTNDQGSREVLPLEGCTEYTVEAGRPDTIDRAKLEVLKGHGVGRISINPQTLEDHVLRAIGRKHAAGDIRAANDLARSVGFDCINMDLIAGLPQDSCEGFRRSLEGVLEMEPENVTIHTLALKKGSTLMERGGSLPSGAEVAEMLDFSREILIRRGYRPYYLYRQKYMSGALENVGWAKPGTENLYNIIMMEELQTVVSVGGGGVTKLVDYAAGRIVRLPNPKYPHDYLTSLKKVLAQKEELIRFYGSELP